jgi:uncharacterized protein (DUF362 family)
MSGDVTRLAEARAASRITRRRLLATTARLVSVAAPLFALGAGLSRPAMAATQAPVPAPRQQSSLARVALVKTADRAEGVRRAIDLAVAPSLAGSRLLLKPNLNSADPSPGSTHPDTLRALSTWLLAAGARQVTLGDRSGMGDTGAVMEQTGTFALARELGMDVVNYDELPADAWVPVRPTQSTWSRGFAVPRVLTEADAVIQTCNLKTHRYGGHFTLSLKNGVGLVAKRVPGDRYDYMSELHGSARQRSLIAEINQAYQPALIVMDGVAAFTTGGPDRGTTVASEVMLAGTDRIAMDAVGVALLRLWGTTPEVSRGTVFEQEQLARAAELGLGVTRPGEIELVTDDAASQAYAAEVRAVLDAG